MLKKYIIALFIFCSSFYCNAQIYGEVINIDKEPLPFVNIYIEGTLNGTTTNDQGQYQLAVPSSGEHVIVFKYLGYKTEKTSIIVQEKGTELNITLLEEGLKLNEIELSANSNPANAIIKNAIAKRKELKEKTRNYTANFYSKGIIKIKNAPERILGQDLGDFGGGLDSTRTGILYLSETISEIAERDGDLKEKIVASKVSGNDNGFSFNHALDVNFSLYNNLVELGSQVVSPIAENAFSYYNYSLKGTFYDDGNRLINQIKVSPKRPQDKTFIGTIYIVEDEWALYATDLKTTGKQVQILPVDTFYLKQSFNYSKQHQTWLKVLQSFDFEYNIFGFTGDGRFTAAYKDYNLEPNFEQEDFNAEILSFEENSNKKDSIYWKSKRAVPLTFEESVDYIVKDSLQTIRKTQKYLDSVDAKGNKFKLTSLLFGYTHSNSFKETYYVFESPLQNVFFNTVQGWHGSLSLDYIKLNEEKGTRFSLGALVNYGLSEKRLRPSFSTSYRFNKKSRPFLRFSAGVEAVQFNGEEPITPTGNSIATLFFGNNFAKFYDRTFTELFHSVEIVNGVRGSINLSYEDRGSLFNTTSTTLFNVSNAGFTSNNPLDPSNEASSAIVDHSIAKLNLDFRIRFGQKYMSYPDEKFNIPNERCPTLNLGYETGFLSNNKENHFHQFKAQLTQDFEVKNKGRFAYNLRAGGFLNAGSISFVDFQHFNGNESHVTIRDYMDSFFLLPYYDLSTNRNYFEGHLEHNFNGWIMNKIPLLKKLNAHLIVSGKLLATEGNAPYSEFGVALGNLGIKKIRFLRLGYAQSYYNGMVEKGLNIGLVFP